MFEDESFDPEYNATESVEFYAVPDEEHGSWDAVYYDSPRSLTPKLALANDRGLAGAGFWAIGYERGLAGLHGADRVVRGGGAAGGRAGGVGQGLGARAWARVGPRCSLGEHCSGWREPSIRRTARWASHPMPRAVIWLAGRAVWRLERALVRR